MQKTAHHQIGGGPFESLHGISENSLSPVHGISQNFFKSRTRKFGKSQHSLSPKALYSESHLMPVFL